MTASTSPSNSAGEVQTLKSRSQVPRISKPTAISMSGAERQISSTTRPMWPLQPEITDSEHNSTSLSVARALPARMSRAAATRYLRVEQAHPLHGGLQALQVGGGDVTQGQAEAAGPSCPSGPWQP